MISISSELLEKACLCFGFPLPEDDLVLFGIRGALPASSNSLNFGEAHDADFAAIDYQNMRCTLGQWDRSSGQVALFPGSTVPSARMIAKAREKGGRGTNRLVPGRLRYQKGIHKSGKPGAHRAFRQAAFFPVRRTANDTSYDNFDEIDFGTGPGDFIWDNLHSAYSDSPARYSSAGCQVVRGMPGRSNAAETGPWKVFIDNAYTRAQDVFVYLLFEAHQIALVEQADPAALRQVVCFGSNGPTSEAVQQALIASGHLTGEADGKFGRLSLMALTAFQKAVLGPAEADGICGPKTAAALGVNLPLLDGANALDPVKDSAEKSDVSREDLPDETDLDQGEIDRLRDLVSLLFGASPRSPSSDQSPSSQTDPGPERLSRRTFFDGVRQSLFSGSLSQSQVEGIDDVLDVWEREYSDEDPRWLAYILATIYHETGRRMVPVREGFATSDAGARRAVAKLFADGRISRDYAEPVGGISYFGRGRVQVTHLDNYRRLSVRFDRDFVNNPGLLLEPRIDAEVAVTGHVEGLWTGRKLSDFIDGNRCDYVEARRIVNRLDKASKIAAYARSFETAVRGAVAAGADKEDHRIPQHEAPKPGGDDMNIDADRISGRLERLERILAIFGAGKTEPVDKDIPPELENFEAIRQLLIKQGVLKPELTTVNGALGTFIGRLLDGKKTAIGLIGSVATAIIGQSQGDSILGQIVNGVLKGIPLLSGMSGPMLPIFLGLIIWGVLGKFDKWRRQPMATPPAD